MTDPGTTLMALFSLEGKANPYPLYEELRSSGPVLRLGDHLFVSGFTECAQVLCDPSLLSTDAAVQDLIQPGWRDHASWQWLTKNMLFSNEPAHDRFRKFFSGALTARHVSMMRPKIVEIVERVIDQFADAGSGDAVIDAMEWFAFRLPAAVMGELLGIEPEMQMSFRQDIGLITLALEPLGDVAELTPGDAAMERLGVYFSELVERRRAEPADDLLSRWAQASSKTGLLSDEELVANLMLLLVAGTEAPMDLVANAVRLAIDHPEEGRRIAESPHLAEDFVQETLRFDPAVQVLNRVASDDMTLWGQEIPGGSKITLLIAAANRDPRRFKDPGRFWPGRPDNQALTFSAGAHFCLGAALARLQTEIGLPRLLQRFPRLSLAESPTYRNQLVQRGYDTLSVRLGV